MFHPEPSLPTFCFSSTLREDSAISERRNKKWWGGPKEDINAYITSPHSLSLSLRVFTHAPVSIACVCECGCVCRRGRDQDDRFTPKKESFLLSTSAPNHHHLLWHFRVVLKLTKRNIKSSLYRRKKSFFFWFSQQRGCGVTKNISPLAFFFSRCVSAARLEQLNALLLLLSFLATSSSTSVCCCRSWRENETGRAEKKKSTHWR